MFDIDLFARIGKLEGATETVDEVSSPGFSWVSILELRFGGVRRHRVLETHRLCSLLRDILGVVGGGCVAWSILDDVLH